MTILFLSLLIKNTSVRQGIFEIENLVEDTKTGSDDSEPINANL